MPHDYNLQEQEEAAEESAWDQVLLDAAVLSATKKLSDDQAIQQAQVIEAERQAAEIAGHVIRDNEGFVTNYLENWLAFPSQETLAQAEVVANYKRLSGN